jgi:hypothetical protein
MFFLTLYCKDWDVQVRADVFIHALTSLETPLMAFLLHRAFKSSDLQRHDTKNIDPSKKPLLRRQTQSFDLSFDDEN